MASSSTARETIGSKGLLYVLLVYGVVRGGGMMFLLASIGGRLLFPTRRGNWEIEGLLSEAVVCAGGGLLLGLLLYLSQALRRS